MKAMIFLALGALMGCAHAAESPFVLKPEWAGPCAKTAIVDVNLGHTPENFVKAAYCQCTGKAPDAKQVSTWAERLRTDKGLRRIDVVRTIANEAGVKDLKLSYSSPWSNDPELAPAPPHKGKRQVGAVVMFFFHCPAPPGYNCGMDWANNHVQGMSEPSASLAWEGKPGYYEATNPGFWRHELHDAKAAGLDFILPNVYGPDMQQEGKVATLVKALAAEKNPVKIGLFDDTWSWGEKWFGPYWQTKPNFNKPEEAAAKLYEAKWKPFFTAIPKANWQLVNGKPLIYFYASGKLEPLNRSSDTFKLMKAMFKKDFGVEPFLAVERAYTQDPRTMQVADAKYTWDPLKYGDDADKISRSNVNGVRLAHAMVRWDALGRDKGAAIASFADHLAKGPEQLAVALKNSKDADLLVFATWNDLGEGTSINRAYDYYYLGRWLQPDTFIRMIAAEQAK